jgi:pyruvyltransferase
LNPLIKKIRQSQYFIIKSFEPGIIFMDYCPDYNNLGDILNPVLVQYISGRKARPIISKYCQYDHLFGIGSIFHRVQNRSIVWGSGVISQDSKIVSKPKKITAVRGPLSRKKLMEEGIECPEVYGDPALLLPRYYHKTISKKYKLGIVPHYVDKKNAWIEKINSEKDIAIIDVQNPQPLEVIDQMLECESIASSSLHGLILADAYGIASVWIEFSKLITGGHFKFMDYYASIGKHDEEAMVITEKTSAKQLLDAAKTKALDIDLDQLLAAFPMEFKS